MCLDSAVLAGETDTFSVSMQPGKNRKSTFALIRFDVCFFLLLPLGREGKEPLLRQFLGLASPPGLPVLLNEELQRLRVGEHHIRV